MKYLALLSLCFTVATFGDATLMMEETGLPMGGSSDVVFKIKDNRILMLNGTDTNQAILFDGEERVITQIDYASKSYTRMDKETTGKVSQQMDAAMAQLEEQLKHMSPEQRKMLEARMPQISGRINKSAQPKFDVKPKGEKDTVAGVKCEVVEMYKDMQLESVACVANADNLGIAAADFATIKTMMNAMQELASEFGSESMPSFDTVGGFPIRTKDVSQADGQHTVLKSVSTDKLKAEDFNVPEDFKRRSIGQ